MTARCVVVMVFDAEHQPHLVGTSLGTKLKNFHVRSLDAARALVAPGGPRVVVEAGGEQTGSKLTNASSQLSPALACVRIERCTATHGKDTDEGAAGGAGLFTYMGALAVVRDCTQPFVPEELAALQAVGRLLGIYLPHDEVQSLLKPKLPWMSA